MLTSSEAVRHLGPPSHYWEDLRVGDVIRGTGITVTEAHLVTWAGLTGDIVSLHLDEEYASATQFGQRIAHGPFTLAVSLGLLTQTGYFTNVVAWLGLDEVRALAPVVLGDTVRPEAELVVGRPCTRVLVVSRPAPVRARTCSSSNLVSSPLSRLSRLPTMQPRKPAGTDRRMGKARGNGALVDSESDSSGARFGHTSGPVRMSASEVIRPDSAPTTAPRVRMRRHSRVMRSTGKLALAAVAVASVARKVTFWAPPMTRVTPTVMITSATAAMRPIVISSRSGRWKVLAHRSCAMALEALSTRPADTASKVAMDTATTSASSRSDTKPSPPPSHTVSAGRARLPPLPAICSPSRPSAARAAMPRNAMSTLKPPIRLIAQIADLRACTASGTVKNRISTCGSPTADKVTATAIDTMFQAPPNELPVAR